MHALFIIDVIHTLQSIHSPTFIEIEPRNFENLTCDLDGIVLPKLNPPMTHPGLTTFGEERHINTWEEYGNKQANKQTLLELEYFEKLLKLFTLFYIFMRIQIFDFIV